MSSKEACGVVLVVVVIIMHAALLRLCNCLEIVLDCLYLPQIIAPYAILGVAAVVAVAAAQSSLESQECFGIGPDIRPQLLQQFAHQWCSESPEIKF